MADPYEETEDTVLRVQDAVRALRAETLYDGGQMANGVSVQFLARLTILAHEARVLEHTTPFLVNEARRILGIDRGAHQTDSSR